jgi:2'-5' RNA ligase
VPDPHHRTPRGSDHAGATPPSHRLFIAVALPPAVLAACRQLISAAAGAPSVVAASGRVRWTHAENLHLTLRFLGGTDPALVPAIGTAMQDAASAVTTFPVVLAGAGTFPRSGPPRAMWLGVTDGRDELTTLVRALDAALAGQVGIEVGTGPYHPHLTIARAGRGQPAAALAAAAALQAEVAGWRTTFDVRRIHLFRSHLGSGPPRYEELVSIVLPA